MDQVVKPDLKIWISKPILLGDVVKQLKLESVMMNHTLKETVSNLCPTKTSLEVISKHEWANADTAVDKFFYDNDKSITKKNTDWRNKRQNEDAKNTLKSYKKSKIEDQCLTIQKFNNPVTEWDEPEPVCINLPSVKDCFSDFSNLSDDDESSDMDYDPSNFHWKTNNVQQQINEDIFYMSLKTGRKAGRNKNTNSASEKTVDRNEDFLVEITVYHGESATEALPDDAKIYKEPKMAYKLEVLGSQTVAQLRDSIRCDADSFFQMEVEHYPDIYAHNFDEVRKNNSTSAVLMIHDVIFNDLRNPDNIEFSSKLIKWASLPPKKNIGPFKEGDMERTKLEDLTVQFGYPYVFIHMGNCEHIMIFNKARLLNKTDEQSLSCYPRVAASTNFKTILCRVDNEYLASWAVFDFNDFPENPMMLCTDCLKLYCYDQNRTKIGSFRLLPFHQLGNDM